MHAPAHAPEPASSRASWLWKLAGPAALAAVALLYLGTRGASGPERPDPKPVAEAIRAEAAPVEKPLAEKPAEPLLAPVTAAEAPAAEPAARKQSPSGVTTKPVPPGATRVRLEVHPADSKVGRRGVTQKPPYEFDVPKGKKLVLEVLRKGCTTRKVTLDGSSPRVVVGLARARSGRGSR